MDKMRGLRKDMRGRGGRERALESHPNIILYSLDKKATQNKTGTRVVFEQFVENQKVKIYFKKNKVLRASRTSHLFHKAKQLLIERGIGLHNYYQFILVSIAMSGLGSHWRVNQVEGVPLIGAF